MLKQKLLFIFFLISNLLLAQTSKIESLKRNINDAKNAELSLEAMLNLCEEYQSLNRDTFNLYINQIKKIAPKSPNNRHKLLADLANVNLYLRWGWADSALLLVNPLVQKLPAENTSTRDIYFKAMRQKGLILGAKSSYSESLTVLFSLLKNAEKYNDTLAMGLTFNTIGSVSLANDESKKAKDWINKALKITNNNSKHSAVLAAANVNMANYYAGENRLDSANFHLEKGIVFARKIENLNIISTALRIKSNILIKQKKFDLAEKALTEMYTIRNKLNGENNEIDDNIQLADFYAQTKQYQKAIEICKKGLKVGDLYKLNNGEAKSYNTKVANQIYYAEALAKYYKMANQLPDYQATLEKVIALKDSFNLINSQETIAELQTKYEVEKKEKTIAEQKLDLIVKNYWLYGSAIFSLLLAIIGWLVFKNYRRKQNYKLKKALEDEKNLAAQQIIDAEEQERKRIAADLHDNIGAYATAIRADVEKINDNGIENSAVFLHNLQQHSDEIIGSLRDTIWVLNKENITITSISDRLKNYVNKLQPSYENLNIQINEEIENDQKISSQNALNIFRIMQEAIHNALKHSKASSLIINIISKDFLNISVTDNGIGLIESKIIKGEGLNNMQMRATEIGMKFCVKDEGNGGTTVLLSDV